MGRPREADELSMGFLCLLLQILTVLAWGISQNDCTPLDIRDANPKIRENSKLRQHYSVPRNQDSTGWCYAFVAADLLSAELGVPVSAFHTSAIFNQHILTSKDREAIEKNRPNFSMIFEGGWVHTAIKAIQKKNWLCSEEGLPFDKSGPRDTHNLIKKLENIKRRSPNLEQKVICEQINSLSADFFLTEKELNDISEVLIKNDLNEALSLYADKACTEVLRNLPEFKVNSVKTPRKGTPKEIEEYWKKMNQILNMGKPIALAYTLDEKIVLDSSEGPHASVIVGRRWKNNRCEIKIRNSWGKSCGSYRSGIECNKNEGSFWVDHETLFYTSDYLYFID
jgi:hypothetical protein